MFYLLKAFHGSGPTSGSPSVYIPLYRVILYDLYHLIQEVPKFVEKILTFCVKSFSIVVICFVRLGVNYALRAESPQFYI